MSKKVPSNIKDSRNNMSKKVHSNIKDSRNNMSKKVPSKKTKSSVSSQKTESKIPPMNKKLVLGLLIIILILSTVLRLWGIKFGLPHIYYIDSTKIVKRSKLIANNIIHKKWDIDPRFYQYPTLLTNLLAIEYVIYGLGYGFITSKTGKYKSMKEAIDVLFREANPAYVYDPYPPVFYLLARLNNAVAGILTVLLCFFLAKLAFENDERAGLLAAFFLCVMFIHTKHSKYPMPDSVLALWTVFAMIYVIKIILRGNLKDYILSGLFIGLGTSTKYLTVFLTAPFMLNAAYNFWQNRTDKILIKRVIIFTLIGLIMIPIGFLAGTPMFLARYREFTGRAIGEHKGLGSSKTGGKYGNTQTCFFDYFFNKVPSWFEPYTYNSLWGAMGIPLLILVLLAFIYFIFMGIGTGTKNKIIYWDFILFITIVYFYLSGKGKNRIMRYFVVAVPFYAVIAGKFLADIANKIPFEWFRARKGIFIGIAAIIIAMPTTMRTIRYNHLMTHTNNRVIAGRWIESNIPQGSKIWMPILYPPCVSREKYEIYFYRGQAKTAGSVVPFNVLKAQGFDYVILSSYDYGMAYSDEVLRDYPEGTLAMLKFYRDVEENAVWSKIFESNLKDLPGPTIKIFKIK